MTNQEPRYPQYFVSNQKQAVDTYDMINDLIIRLKELQFREEFFIKGQYDDIKYEIKVERI